MLEFDLLPMGCLLERSRRWYNLSQQRYWVVLDSR